MFSYTSAELARRRPTLLRLMRAEDGKTSQAKNAHEKMLVNESDRSSWIKCDKAAAMDPSNGPCRGNRDRIARERRAGPHPF
jgi:hypothetical protein